MSEGLSLFDETRFTNYSVDDGLPGASMTFVPGIRAGYRHGLDLHEPQLAVVPGVRSERT
jgi:hypothetical protein